MMSGLILLGLFFAGLLLTAFFAGYETGFVSCNPIRVRYLAEKENDPNALRLLAYLHQPDRMLTVVLLGTNLSLVLGTIAITQYLRSSWLSMIVATPLVLVFAEILPKSVFRTHPTRLALWLLPVIRAFEVFLSPVVGPITWLSRHLLDPVQGQKSATVRMLMRSPEDMRVLVDESADRGTLEEEEKEMIHSVMDLQTRLAKEVMVPRIDIQALPHTATRKELVAMLKESGYTRIPIYRASIDEIIGVVNAFDVLKDHTPENPDITRFVKNIIHVHDTMKLDDVLKVMRDKRQAMAIVADEYGGTYGLITLEDILEEIFGEIHDEHDQEEPPIRQVGPHDYLVNARTSLEDVSETLGIPIVDEEVETVGGWVMHVTGRVPQKGEVVVHGRFRITILDGRPNFVSNIRLEVRPAPEEDAPVHRKPR